MFSGSMRKALFLRCVGDGVKSEGFPSALWEWVWSPGQLWLMNPALPGPDGGEATHVKATAVLALYSTDVVQPFWHKATWASLDSEGAPVWRCKVYLLLMSMSSKLRLSGNNR